MADMNSTGAKAAQSTEDSINEALQSAATAADSRTAAAVSSLTLIQQARLTNQKRAATLATAVHGANSSQATAAQKIVAQTTTTSARLSAITQQAQTAAPTVPAGGWVFHGRVYSSDLAPQSGYAVFFVDASKNYLNEYGYSYTDDTGYFLISSSGSAAGANQPGTNPSGQAGQSQSAAVPSQLFVQVTDTKANPVLLSQTVFAPTIGKATYQTINLPAGDKKLGDLPAEVRAVALPDFKKPKPVQGNPDKTS